MRYNRSLQWHPNVKVHLDYRLLLLSKMGLLSIVRFKTRSSTFAKFVEIVERSRFKLVFFIFHSEDTLKLCLHFSESQPIYS